MLDKIKKINIDSFFVKLYVVISLIYLIVKMIIAYIDDEVLLDTFLIYFGSISFALISDIRNYFGSMFYGIGILSIPLILHFGILFYHLLENLYDYLLKNVTFDSRYIEYICMVSFPVLTILIYVIARCTSFILPLCIVEGFSTSGVLFLISKVYKKVKKV